MKFVIIESDGEGGGLITHHESKDLESAISWADEMRSCAFVVLNEQDYYNMCMQGVGCK